MLESRKERVRHLYYEEGRNTLDIARIERISIRDISAIIKEEEARKQSHEDDSQKQLEGKISAAAYSLFNQGKTPVEVVIELEYTEPQVSKLYKGYLRLKGLPEIVSLCDIIGEDAWAYLEMYQFCNSSGMSNKEIVKAVDIALNKLPHAEENYFQNRKKIAELAETERELLDHREALKGENFSLINEISDLKTRRQKLVESCNKKKREVEKLQQDQQQILNTMYKYQQKVIGMIVGAVYLILKEIEADMIRAMEVREMYKSDIA